MLSGSKLSSVSLSSLPPPPAQCPRNMRLRYCRIFQKLSLGETTALPPIENLDSLRAAEIELSRGQLIRHHVCAIVALLRHRPQTNPLDVQSHPAGMSDRLREKWRNFRQRAKTAGNEENLSQWLSTLLTWAQEGDDAIQVLFCAIVANRRKRYWRFTAGQNSLRRCVSSEKHNSKHYWNCVPEKVLEVWRENERYRYWWSECRVSRGKTVIPISTRFRSRRVPRGKWTRKREKGKLGVVASFDGVFNQMKWWGNPGGDKR